MLACNMLDAQYSPTEFDVLLTDVHSRELRYDISNKLNKLYLSDVVDNEDFNTGLSQGILWGPNVRIFVTMAVRVGALSKYVHFLVDTGSPRTYICQEVFTSFRKMISNPKNPVSLHINGNPLSVLQSPERSHFEDVNILGTDYMKTFNCLLNVDFSNDTVSLVQQGS